MSKIQKVSDYLLVVFNILLISVPLMIVVQWVFIGAKVTDTSAIFNFFGLFEKIIQTPEGIIHLSTVHWTSFLKILGFGSDVLSIAPFILSLIVLKSIFKNYQKGEIFSAINACHYKNLGWLFLLDALIIKSLSNMLMVLAVTLTNPPGHRYLNLQFGIPNLKALFFGVLLVVISWVMLEASKLHDDQKLTI